MGVSIHHIDVAVSDVERSLAFYLGLLRPFGYPGLRQEVDAAHRFAVNTGVSLHGPPELDPLRQGPHDG